MNFPIIQHIYKYFHDNVFCIKHETKTMLECVLFINLMFEHRNNGCVNHETMDILLNIKLCSFCLRTRKMVIIFVKSSVRKMSECTHRNKPDIMWYTSTWEIVCNEKFDHILHFSLLRQMPDVLYYIKPHETHNMIEIVCVFLLDCLIRQVHEKLN